jgi:molybdate transport system substrate-binding protein
MSVSCSRPAQTRQPRGPVVVAAAISLKNAFQDLASLYTARSLVQVDFSFGASGELTKQIEAGAPVDIFASAGEREMNELQSRNLLEVPSRNDFARNTLALILPAGSRDECEDVRCLLRPEFKRIAVGDPKTVPAGMYAEQMFRHLGLWSQLKPRLIFAQNVRQALEYVARGEVNAGIVYATDVPIAHGRVIEAARVPAGSYGPILYPMAILRGASHESAARQFVEFVLSPAGQGVLKKFGFFPVQQP